MVFDEAIATTFSLDPTTLLTVPVHLALLAGIKEELLRDGIALLESIRRVSGRITVYLQRGRMQAPESPNLLYGLLEPMIVDVNAPRGGVFHPKIWLMKFKDPTGEDAPLYRLIVLSRNLTMDRSWDLSLQLEGRAGSRYRAESRELGEMIAALPELSKTPVSPERTAQAQRLADELRHIDWELPFGVDSLEFFVFGIKRRAWTPSPSSRMAIISPFCTDEALKHLSGTSNTPTVLISRSETLLDLTPATRELFSRCLTLDDAAETEDGEETEPVESLDTLGLHAKAYVFERGWDTHLVMGSANATNAALLSSNNVEVLVELVGKRSKIGGVESLVATEGLGEVLTEFTGSEHTPVIDEARKTAEAAVESARKILANAILGLRCEGPFPEGEWKLAITGAFPSLPGITNCRAWPITVTSDHGVELKTTERFSEISLGEFSAASLTGLVAFDLKTSHPEVYSRFVLNLPVEGMPEARNTELLRTVVRNQEGFLRYLLLLLGGLEDATLPLTEEKGKGNGFWGNGNITDMPLMEELTRAYCRAPDRLQEIQRVIKRLTGEKDTESIVPPEFLDLWQVFEDVLAEGGRHE
jgi:hypothetical protein